MIAIDPMIRHYSHISTVTNRFPGAGSAFEICVRFVQVLICLATSLCLDAVPSRGQDVVDTRKEYNVKAVTLYAFGRYVTWPNTAFDKPDSPFVIGLFGSNPFGDALNQIAAKKNLGGRPIVIRQFTAPEECSNCHILFVAASVPSETEAKLFEKLARKAVLVVGESAGFAERGGIVNFYQSGDNVRFELNPDKANEAQLSFDAKLLSLGTKVPSRK
jgi:uncharacterized protein DUF4154